MDLCLKSFVDWWALIIPVWWYVLQSVCSLLIREITLMGSSALKRSIEKCYKVKGNQRNSGSESCVVFFFLLCQNMLWKPKSPGIFGLSVTKATGELLEVLIDQWPITQITLCDKINFDWAFLKRVMWEITIDHADSLALAAQARMKAKDSFNGVHCLICQAKRDQSVCENVTEQVKEEHTRFSVIGILFPFWKNTISVSSAGTEHAMLFVHLDETIVCMTKAVDPVEVCVKLMC